jgi:hypothetical protein
MTLGTGLRLWLHADRRVRHVLGDYRLVGKSLEGARQPGEEAANPASFLWADTQGRFLAVTD